MFWTTVPPCSFYDPLKHVPRVRTLRLVAEARQNSTSSWTINGLDGATFQLEVDETATAARRQVR